MREEKPAELDSLARRMEKLSHQGPAAVLSAKTTVQPSIEDEEAAE